LGGIFVSEIIGYESQCAFPVRKQEKRVWKICGGTYMYQAAVAVLTVLHGVSGSRRSNGM
jgi:hypothetical protein